MGMAEYIFAIPTFREILLYPQHLLVFSFFKLHSFSFILVHTQAQISKRYNCCEKLPLAGEPRYHIVEHSRAPLQRTDIDPLIVAVNSIPII